LSNGILATTKKIARKREIARRCEFIALAIG
jgi:hypothetical protein